MDILSHVAEPYWRLQLRLRGAAGMPTAATAAAASEASQAGGEQAEAAAEDEQQEEEGVFLVDWARGRLFDEPTAQMLEALARRETSAVVTELSCSEERRGRPEGLNTVAMLKIASAALGIGAQRAMHIAEALYMAGGVSYSST